jgi:hypothetical protein
MSSHRSVRSVIAAAGLAALTETAYAQTLSTAFTYQGRLTEAGNPGNGPYDFQFKLFDASSGGIQLGGTASVNDLAVASGLFTARIDFGNQFNGNTRWLQVEVRPGASTGAYTVLSSRQELTGTPYALGPWQTVTGAGHPANGVHLNAAGGTSDLWVDALNGDLNFNGGSDGFFGFYNRGVNAGRTEFLSARGINMAIANQTGNVGINVIPAFRLHVNGTPADQFTFVVQNHSTLGGNAIRGVVEADGSGNFSSGVTGVNNAPAGPSGGFAMYAEHTNGGTGIRAIGHGNGTGVEGLAQGVNAWGGYFKNTAGGVALFADGPAMVRTLQILGGADLAEPFNVHSEEDKAVQPGMVVTIDPANPGELRLADQPYDSKVAGVISGANGLSPGMVMKAEGAEHADGSHPIAMTGRVWCYVDASFGAITPGVRLTTSPTPGHAMAASDATQAGGAVIGKAMTELKEGKGLVLVLVNLQ